MDYLGLHYLTYTTYDFLKFITSKNVIQFGIALVIGTQLTALITVFTNTMISPIINRVVQATKKDKSKTLKDYNVSIFGINFEVGQFLQSFISFLIIMLVVFYLVRTAEKINANLE